MNHFVSFIMPVYSENCSGRVYECDDCGGEIGLGCVFWTTMDGDGELALCQECSNTSWEEE